MSGGALGTLTVSLRTPAGQEKQRWEAALLEDTAERIVAHGAWRRTLHTRAGEVAVQNQTLECYWPGQPYTVAAVYDQGWALREHYARLVRPLEREGQRLNLVDLGRHLSLKPDRQLRVIEEARPSTNGTGQASAANAAAWEALMALVKDQDGPFSTAFFERYKPDR